MLRFAFLLLPLLTFAAGPAWAQGVGVDRRIDEVLVVEYAVDGGSRRASDLPW